MVPVRVNVPRPILVKAPVEATLAPFHVKLVPPTVTSKVAVVPLVIVKLRFVEAVAPVYCRLPPPKTRFAAAFVA